MQTDTLPLLATASLHRSLVNYRGRLVDVAQFTATVQALLPHVPTAKFVINLCENRYHFLLSFIVACLREQITLLPPNQTAGTLSDLQANYPDHQVFDDARVERLLSLSPADAASNAPEWRIAAERVVALTFTSGSTGIPQAHSKTWRCLVRNAQLAAAEVLGGAGTNLVATVPAQHVYGLETTAISALVGECAVFDGKPFFPLDVPLALAAMPEPRTLVTTPTHLRALVDAKIQLPALQRIVSATAPLAVELAEQIERAWRVPVFEIYGCTEAGIMAMRRAIESPMWRTFTGGLLTVTDEGALYAAPQLSSGVPLQDIIESVTPTTFYLRGRSTDMIKVAGKRLSLQELTQRLLAIDGVSDAIVFVPHADARPAALVVASNRSAAEILAVLGNHIEAVFLPRPLILLDKLPRNAVGKLPQSVLLEILDQHRKLP
ncbi:MAG: acyl-CoA synthetase [Candidatus Obscuribacterales bacterium]|nr:acyl-CoA synthetase [Steroidobacteraceae bacterium]